ncbi:Dhh1-like SF II RNA helicase [Cryptosporidium canis]|uniref:ATP-dependent RNA helicase n=1 Tax=Cryptosporidium canis TaxID=195482 RepID=A0A9D5DQM4_9CRYT|nr:Dhh1-like SF II RNA helicase [Cryptosporidium canis]
MSSRYCNVELSDDITIKANHSLRFTDFHLHESLVDSLFDNGFIFPSPVQYHILSQGVIKENLVVQAKSGTGKTIAFVILILNEVFNIIDCGFQKSNLRFELLSLIIAPTREICIQTSRTISMFVDSVKSVYQIDNICCIGGNPISDDLEKIRLNIPTIMTSTPGRFIQIINSKLYNFFPIDSAWESLLFLVFDEADRLLEDCFVEQSTFLLDCCLSSSNAQFVAFSATFPLYKLQQLKGILYDVNSHRNEEKLFQLRLIQLCSSFGAKHTNPGQLNVLNCVQDIRCSNRSRPILITPCNTLETPVLKNLKFFLYDIFLNGLLEFSRFNENNYHQWAYVINSVVDILIRVPYKQAFIFTNNGPVGYKIMSVLKSINIPALYTSGKRSQSEREDIINCLQEGKCRVIVCSDLLARGIDVRMADLVISVDAPIDKETFLHRAGRSGRFGRSGVVICIPSHKQDYESFLYFFDQLGIPYSSFCEYYALEKNDAPYLVFNSTNFEMSIVTTATHALGLSDKDICTHLNCPKYMNYTDNIDNTCRLSGKISLDINLFDLHATDINDYIMRIWRAYGDNYPL